MKQIKYESTKLDISKHDYLKLSGHVDVGPIVELVLGEKYELKHINATLRILQDTNGAKVYRNKNKTNSGWNTPQFIESYQLENYINIIKSYKGEL
jgi:hypothetical protein